MKEGYMVTFFAAQDSRRRERPCGHDHIMVTFFCRIFQGFSRNDHDYMACYTPYMRACARKGTT